MADAHSARLTKSGFSPTVRGRTIPSLLSSYRRNIRRRGFACIGSGRFLQQKNREIYTAIQQLYRGGMAVDLVTVNDKLEKMGKSDNNTLTYLTERIPCFPRARTSVLRKHIASRLCAPLSNNGLHKITEESLPRNDENATLRYAEELIYGISKEVRQADLTHLPRRGRTHGEDRHPKQKQRRLRVLPRA
jgi:replicative DNA helicase